MPMYEGIGLINEKHPVVLEIGRSLTKAGFAGETSPRCIIPSGIRGKDGITFRRLVDYKDSTDLYQMLVEFLHRLYCRYLLVTPKDRKVVVVESLFATTVWRQTLAKVLYLHYEVLTVLWIPIPIASVSTTNLDTALIVDFGSEEVQVIPVFKGVTVLSSIVCHELGADTFDKELKSILMESCLSSHSNNREELDRCLTPDKVEDIRVRCCVVTSSSRRDQILSMDHTSNDDASDKLKFKPFLYELDGRNFLNFHGSARERAGEVWFKNDDQDGISVPLMILQVLSTCPVDTRKALASAILITGGTGMLPGLKGRLLRELASLVTTSAESLWDPVLKERFAQGTSYEFKIYDPPVKENCTAWLGGALYGATEALTLRGVSKDWFLKHEAVPDWCDQQIVNGISNNNAFGSPSFRGLV